MEGAIFSSKNFSSNLQAIESVAGELKVKNEPRSEEAENQVIYQSVPSPAVGEDGKREIKVESVDASSESSALPLESMPPRTNHFSDAEAIIKEEDLGIWFEEGEGSTQLDLNSSVPSGKEQNLHCWDQARAIVQIKQETTGIGGNEISSQVTAVSSPAEAEDSTDCEGSGSLHAISRTPLGEGSALLKCRLRLRMQELLRTDQVVRRRKPDCPADFSKSEEVLPHVECVKLCKEEKHAVQRVTGHSERAASGGQELGIRPGTLSSEKPYSCPVCSATFKWKSHLKSHLPSHSNVKPFSCAHCAATFKRKQCYQRHLHIHASSSDGKQFSSTALPSSEQLICPHCLAKFSNAGCLKRHLVVHSDSRPFPCTYCGGTFRNKGGLHSHMLTHRDPSAVKQFPCPQCPATFVNIGSFHQHLTVHSNEKPFSCPHCASKFKMKAHLARHLIRHFSVTEQFLCSQCDD